MAAETRATIQSIGEAARRATEDSRRIADLQVSAAQVLDATSVARLQAAIVADLQGTRNRVSSFTASYQPIRDAIRDMQAVNEANWRAMVESLRIPSLAELSTTDLFGVAAVLATEEELVVGGGDVDVAADLERLGAGTERRLDETGKVGLLAIFVALLVVTGKMEPDDGKRVIDFLIALLPLALLYAGQDRR